MSRLGKCLEVTYESLRKKTKFEPQIALVLGSGLGNYGKKIDIVEEVPYSEINGFPVSTVPGHEGKFLFGYIDDIPVVCMQGRVHYYEGYKMSEVVLPARLMHKMGAKILFLSNAAGCVNPDWKAGTLMLIRDHIAFHVPNPLIGENVEECGVRFPDMTNIYDNELCEIIKKSADKLGVDIKEGIYFQDSGPSYETPAEVRMAHMLGADAIGMSTAVEAIAAKHCGMKVCGISCITNMGAGISQGELNHKEVEETANRVANDFESLVTESIINMKSLL